MQNYFRQILLCFLIAIQGCALHAQLPAEAAVSTPTSGEQENQQIILSLHAGRYADAIAATRAAQAGVAEKDFAVGEIILQGWADDAAVQHPLEALEVGIALLEKSALTGHPQALSGLSALFFTGLVQTRSGKELIARDPDLHTCWKQAEALPAQAMACVASRKNAGQRR